MKLPAIPGMEDFAGRSFHTARWDYEYTGGGPTSRSPGWPARSSALIGTGASGIQCVPPLAESAEACLRLPAHAVGHRRAGQPAHRPRLRRRPRAGLAAGPDGQLPGDHAGPARRRRPGRRRLDPPLRRGPAPPTQGGHDAGRVPAQRRGIRLQDHGGAPAPGRGAGGRPGHGRDPQALLPLPLQAALLPRRVPAGLQQPERHPGRLPGRHRADHRPRARSSTGSSTRSTASSTAPASRPSSPPSTAGPATRSSAAAASPWPRSGPTGPPASSA